MRIQLHRACDSAIEEIISMMNLNNNWKKVYSDGAPIPGLTGTTEYKIKEFGVTFKAKAFRIMGVLINETPTNVVAIAVIAKKNNEYLGNLSVFYPANANTNIVYNGPPLFGGPVYCEGQLRIGAPVDVEWGPIIAAGGNLMYVTNNQLMSGKPYSQFQLWPRKWITDKISYINSPWINIRNIENAGNIIIENDAYWQNHDYGKIVVAGHGKFLKNKIDLIDKDNLKTMAQGYLPNSTGLGSINVSGFDWIEAGQTGYFDLNGANIILKFNGWHPSCMTMPVFFFEGGNVEIWIYGDTCIGNDNTPVIIYVNDGLFEFELQNDYGFWVPDNTDIYNKNKLHITKLPPNAQKEYLCSNTYGDLYVDGDGNPEISPTAPVFWDTQTNIGGPWEGLTADIEDVFFNFFTKLSFT